MDESGRKRRGRNGGGRVVAKGVDKRGGEESEDEIRTHGLETGERMRMVKERVDER